MISFAMMLSANLLLAGNNNPLPLRIENGWVREAPPVARVLAGYARLCNDSSAPMTLSGAGSASFERVEMHATVETGTATTMQQLETVTIDSRACVEFAPGGRHFMLFEPKGALRDGDNVKFVLKLADGREMETVFPVRRADDVIEEHHGHHHGH